MQGYGLGGVIRKAGSRAGKFKDHEGKGVRLYHHQNFALYEVPALDCTRSHAWQVRYHNMFEGQHNLCPECARATWRCILHTVQVQAKKLCSV